MSTWPFVGRVSFSIVFMAIFVPPLVDGQHYRASDYSASSRDKGIADQLFRSLPVWLPFWSFLPIILVICLPSLPWRHPRSVILPLDSKR